MPRRRSKIPRLSPSILQGLREVCSLAEADCAVAEPEERGRFKQTWKALAWLDEFLLAHGK